MNKKEKFNKDKAIIRGTKKMIVLKKSTNDMKNPVVSAAHIVNQDKEEFCTQRHRI